MMHRHALSLLCLLVSTLAFEAQASDQKFWGYQDFSKPLGNACHERWKRNGGNDGNRPNPQVCDPVSSQYSAKSAQEGAWRLTISTLCTIESSWYAVGNSRPMMSYKAPAAIENFGDHMTFSFLSQKVTDAEVTEVEKQLKERRDDMAKEYKDTQVQLTRLNGAYALTAQTDFSKGLSRGEVEDRIVWLTGQAQFLMCDITNGQEKYRMAEWDRLKGADLTHLSKAEFYTLNQTLHEGYKEVDGDGKEGNWSVSFGGGSYKIFMENWGDKMVLWLAVPHKETSTGPVSDKAWEVVNKWAQKNVFEDAHETKVLWDTNWVWIGSDYPYKGLTGKKVMNLVKDYENEYAPESTDDVRDELEDINL